MHGELDLGVPSFVALFDFKKEKELELSLTRGEELVILNSDNPEWLWVQNVAGWCLGCLLFVFLKV
jgi:hypothetical protein